MSSPFDIRWGFEVEQINIPTKIREETRSSGLTLFPEFDGHEDSGNWEVATTKVAKFKPTIHQLFNLFFYWPDQLVDPFVPFIYSNEDAGCHFHVSLNYSDLLSRLKKVDFLSESDFNQTIINYLKDYFKLYNILVAFQPVFLGICNFRDPYRDHWNYMFDMAMPSSYLNITSFISCLLKRTMHHPYISPSPRVVRINDYIPKRLTYQDLWTPFIHAMQLTQNIRNEFLERIRTYSMLDETLFPRTLEIRMNENHFFWIGEVSARLINNMVKEIMKNYTLESICNIIESQHLPLLTDADSLHPNSAIGNNYYMRFEEDPSVKKVLEDMEHYIFPFPIRSQNFTIKKEYKSQLHFYVHILNQLQKFGSEYRNIVKFLGHLPAWSFSRFNANTLNEQRLLWSPWLLNTEEFSEIISNDDFWRSEQIIRIKNPYPRHPFNKSIKLPGEVVIKIPKFRLNHQEYKNILKEVRS